MGKYGADLFAKRNINPFWNDVFKSYANLNTKMTPKAPEELLSEPLFFNKNFKIGKKTFLFPDWVDQNITKVGALVKRDGKFMTLNEFTEEYNFNPRLLDFFGCINTIKDYIRKHAVKLTSNRAHGESKMFVLLTEKKEQNISITPYWVIQKNLILAKDGKKFLKKR